MVEPAVMLYLGGQPHSVQGERDDLPYARCFTPVHQPSKGLPTRAVPAILDSGAFSDPPTRRLPYAAALERQLCWERGASGCWGRAWRADAVVSYDCLIDEYWEGSVRRKRRWSVQDAAWAVEQTVGAARYLASQRAALRPRQLILAAQGVSATQYARCVHRILEVAAPGDWVGLGGWCVLGRWTSYLAGFFATLERILGPIAEAGLKRLHIFGVLFRPALGRLLWMADQYGLAVSTDSSAPLLACSWRNARKAGVRAAGWRANVRWWIDELAALRASRYYRPPPARQLALDWSTDAGQEGADADAAH